MIKINLLPPEQRKVKIPLKKAFLITAMHSLNKAFRPHSTATILVSAASFRRLRIGQILILKRLTAPIVKRSPMPMGCISSSWAMPTLKKSNNSPNVIWAVCLPIQPKPINPSIQAHVWTLPHATLRWQKAKKLWHK